MPGMRGDVEEHPASSNAGQGGLARGVEIECRRLLGRADLQRRMMATAMRIMSTWWKPRNGINPGRTGQPAVIPGRSRGVRRTLHAHCEA